MPNNPRAGLCFWPMLALCVVLAVLAWVRLACAHDFWTNQDKYRSPSAAGLYIGTHCCGMDDIHPIVEHQDFEADGANWKFLDGPANAWSREHWNLDLVGRTWPRDRAQVYDSEDLQSWIAVGPLGIRCLFISLGGF